MDRSSLVHFSLFSLLLVGISDAALPSEQYWHKVLPDTPMPDVIRAFLYPDFKHEKSIGEHVRKGGFPFFYDTYEDTEDKVHDDPFDFKHEKSIGEHVRKGSFPFFYDTYEDTKDQIHDDPSGYYFKHEKATTEKVVKGSNVLQHLSHEKSKVQDEPSINYFFLETDLKPNKKINTYFTKNTPGATFLPHAKAQAIPFSSAKFPEILRHFSIQPESEEAKSMKQTLKHCEHPAINGEDKLCATSLESMVDFAMSKLGRDVRVLATRTSKESHKQQQYMITAEPYRVVASQSVSCHSLDYAYAIFYCHETLDTEAYMVPLVGEDGSKVEAVAVCHEDTSAWSPKHQAFKLLKVKPGTVPVCHFFPLDNIAWVPTTASLSI